MKTKKILCVHKYRLVASKKNFYGSVELLECAKCEKQKKVTKGYPYVGSELSNRPAIYKHYDINGNEH